MSPQHRRMTFYFDAASCSGCKACQIACKDRHGLEVGRLWRRVSEVTGGGWERDGSAWRTNVFAYHLSMSCNHCERPICLEGCPTKAITQRPDGVVLISADHCMGCGYCGWVCPYSAPQYHAERGVMTKCSFCAKDLDKGLEAACVASCPVRALDAGSPDELATRHSTSAGAEGVVPLPPSDLTEPALLIAPHAQAHRSREAETELRPRPPRGLREWSLVVFTVLSQTAAGLALFAGGLRLWLQQSQQPRSLDHALLPVLIGLMIAAMFASTLHLGRPRNAVRSIMNLGSSWLSREISLAMVLLVTAAIAWWPKAPESMVLVSTWAGWLTLAVAIAFLAGIARVYMQRTVPVWNHWRTPLTFSATAVLLGGLTTNATLWGFGELSIETTRIASLTVISLCVVGVGLPWCLLLTLRRRKLSCGPTNAVSGGAAVIIGLILCGLLLARPEAARGAAPSALSWVALGLALVDQLGQRRKYYARYERLGI